MFVAPKSATQKGTDFVDGVDVLRAGRKGHKDACRGFRCMPGRIMQRHIAKLKGTHRKLKTIIEAWNYCDVNDCVEIANCDCVNCITGVQIPWFPVKAWKQSNSPIANILPCKHVWILKAWDTIASKILHFAASDENFTIIIEFL